MNGITLIGMPGSGKSTIGKLLADRLGWNFVDLDILIKEKTGKGHAEILEQDGEKELLRLEELLTLELNFSQLVFSPGGSIVYSPRAMEKLREETNILYLTLPLSEIKIRLGDQIDYRGIVGLKKKGIDKLFEERVKIYKFFTHHTLDCYSLNERQIVENVLKFIR